MTERKTCNKCGWSKPSYCYHLDECSPEYNPFTCVECIAKKKRKPKSTTRPSCYDKLSPDKKKLYEETVNTD